MRSSQIAGRLRDYEFSYFIQDADGIALDVTGWTWELHINRKNVVTPALTATMGDGIAVPAANLGRVDISRLAALMTMDEGLYVVELIRTDTGFDSYSRHFNYIVGEGDNYAESNDITVKGPGNIIIRPLSSLPPSLVGIPVGGTTGQVLAKLSNTDYAVGWVAPGGGGSGANLSFTRDADSVLIQSDSGTDADIPAATTALAGVMSGADKTKLDGIAAGATANAGDAQLRDRATHTGTQAATTVTNAPAGNIAAITVQAAINELDNEKQASLGFTPENAASKGVAGGYASLDGGGKVPAAQLPGYVDDVLEFADFASLPGIGAAGVLYVTQDNNKAWRWTGSAYLEISPGPGSTDAVAEGSVNLYFTAARVLATVLTGFSTASSAVVTAADTVLSAFGKLQAQVSLKLNAAAVSAFGLTLIDDADAATARTTLGLGTLATQSGTFSGTSSGTNTGDQNSIVGISGTKAQFDTAASDGNFAWVGDALAGKLTGGNWKVFYTDGSGAITELALGAAGKVMTSNGAAAPPTFETPAGGGGFGDAAGKFYFFEDFAQAEAASYSAIVSGAGAALTLQAPDGIRFGRIRSNLGTTSTGRTRVGSSILSAFSNAGLGILRWRCSMCIDTLSTSGERYAIRNGFIDSGIGESSNALYFRYDSEVNGGRWEAVSRDAGAETAADTGVAPSAGTYQLFDIETNAAGTSVDFKINGATVATITTNLPDSADAFGYGIFALKSVGTTAVLTYIVDYWEFEQQFTTPRTP